MPDFRDEAEDARIDAENAAVNLNPTVEPMPLILYKQDPNDRARRFRRQRRPHLVYWRGKFWSWNGTCYREVGKDHLLSEINEFLDGAKQQKDDKILPYWPSPDEVKNTFQMMQYSYDLRADLKDQPFWLDDTTIDPSSLITFSNGTLNITTRELLEPKPELFSTQGCRFAYDPAAPRPERWLTFLNQAFCSEQEQIDCLQEIFGYMLMNGNPFQKMFLVVGPPRSGKGTIAGILKELLAEGSISAPSLSSFSETFGLESMIGTSVALLEDVRSRKGAELAVVTEKLLTITGGGQISINRKYLPAWVGPFLIKIIMLSNEIPAFEDNSPAIAIRIIALTTKGDFPDQEDIYLLDKLRMEMSGILIWALKGLDRLLARGRFMDIEESKAIRRRIAGLASPVRVFLEDTCLFGPDVEVSKRALFEAYLRWSMENGITPPLNIIRFGEAVRAVMGARVGEKRSRPDPKSVSDRRIELYTGLTFRDPRPGDSAREHL